MEVSHIERSSISISGGECLVTAVVYGLKGGVVSKLMGKDDIVFDVQGWSKGLYFVKVNSESGSVMQKFILK